MLPSTQRAGQNEKRSGQGDKARSTYGCDQFADQIVDRLKGIGVHMFVGEQDLPYLERMNVTREALRAAGIPSDLTIIPGSGHVINFLRGANARMMFDAM